MNYSELKDALIAVLEQGDTIHNQRSAMIDVLQLVNEGLIQPKGPSTKPKVYPKARVNKA